MTWNLEELVQPKSYCAVKYYGRQVYDMTGYPGLSLSNTFPLQKKDRDAPANYKKKSDKRYKKDTDEFGNHSTCRN